MSIRIYNTLTGEKEEFAPINPPDVGMYVCGVTVYDLCHVGHARSAVVFDVIYRFLKFRGYNVTYVRNFTDVDDKIIKRAGELGVAWSEVAARYIDEFNNDMGALGMLKPDVEPKATEHIPEMLGMIATLVEKGFAYELNGSVYFSVKNFPDYGKLSGKKTDDLLAGARVEVDGAKHDPLDFALWKASKPGEPAWDSPWGKGRPGWHIECSAMGRKYLGVTFDIHGGGKDLVFPHHENEIAQSQGASGVAPVKVWIHNGFVNINAEKMSKSIGNFLTIKDMLKIYHPEALRFFLLSSHYKSPMDFTEQALGDAMRSIMRFYEFLGSVAVMDGADQTDAGEDTALTEKFTNHMDDDFNTATALACLVAELRRLNQLRAETARLKRKSDNYKKNVVEILRGGATLKKLGWVLGLFQLDPTAVMERFKSEKLKKNGMSREQIDSMIEARANARAQKDFALADSIREELREKGIMIHDTASGARWSVSLD